MWCSFDILNDQEEKQSPSSVIIIITVVVVAVLALIIGLHITIINISTTHKGAKYAYLQVKWTDNEWERKNKYIKESYTLNKWKWDWDRIQSGLLQ